jgi:hypothetical protein
MCFYSCVYVCTCHPQGFVAMAESLPHNHTLKSLNIWRVGAGSHGGSMLAKSMVLNESILFCDISHNNMDMKDVVKIAAHLDSNLAAFEQDERDRRLSAASEQKVEQEMEDKRSVSWLIIFIIICCCSSTW